MGYKELLIVLNQIPKLGPIKVQSLTDKFNNYSDFMKAKYDDFLEIPGIGRVMSDNIIKYRDKIDPSKEIKKAKNLGAEIVTIFDKTYPELLKQIYDSPPVLYIKGDFSHMHNKSIALVGARKASTYGKNVAIAFGKELASMGINVVSGMARGIDSFAHKGAIDAGGPTTAVLGCGIDVVYPPENITLAKKILDCGCIVSSFPIGMAPLAANFPARNRIISGLSLGVVVIEAAKRSGSLITADFALEQGREVFAVPGNIFSPYSRGAHKLIKQGAKLVENTNDILEELYLERFHNEEISSNAKSDYDNLGSDEKNVLDKIDYQPIHIEQLINSFKKSSQEINIILTRLELKGLISALPGGFFIRN